MMKETKQQQPRAQQCWLRLPCYINVMYEGKHITLRFLGPFGVKESGSGLLPTSGFLWELEHGTLWM